MELLELLQGDTRNDVMTAIAANHYNTEKGCYLPIEIPQENIDEDLTDLFNKSEDKYENIMIYKKGYSYDSYNCAYVPYKDNSIVVYEIDDNKNSLSSGFSGCYMATFKYNKRKYVAHIAAPKTEAYQHAHVVKWNAVVKSLTDVVLFKPISADELVNEGVSTVWGLITSGGNCCRLVVSEETKSVPQSLTGREFSCIPKDYPKLTFIEKGNNEIPIPLPQNPKPGNNCTIL